MGRLAEASGSPLAEGLACRLRSDCTDILGEPETLGASAPLLYAWVEGSRKDGGGERVEGSPQISAPAKLVID